jgi:hypothetical protein
MLLLWLLERILGRMIKGLRGHERIGRKTHIGHSRWLHKYWLRKHRIRWRRRCLMAGGQFFLELIIENLILLDHLIYHICLNFLHLFHFIELIFEGVLVTCSSRGSVSGFSLKLEHISCISSRVHRSLTSNTSQRLCDTEIINTCLILTGLLTCTHKKVSTCLSCNSLLRNSQ